VELGAAERVVVNPPRKGCAPAVLQALASLAPSRAAYVSCDPATLARDVAALARLGYEATRVVPVDMLPQTDHLEAVALLEPRRAGRGTARRVPVLYEDDEILVVDKPPLVPVQQGTGTVKTLIDLLCEDRGDEARRYALAHRLDAETSGVLVLAKTREAAQRMGRLFEGREVAKRYVCLAKGIVREKGVVNRPLAQPGEAPKEARTKYRRLMLLRGHSLLAVTPQTGRLHQIRKHLAAIGHPIVGDERYGDAPTNRHFAERYAVGRLLLHAAALAFPHPTSSARVAVAAPLPGDISEVLTRLGVSRPVDTTGLLRGLGEPAGPRGTRQRSGRPHPRPGKRW
jgi:23S rRNA (uracil1939-C5)-methyltransferase